jgi:rhodanese-related sulfurtransferase
MIRKYYIAVVLLVGLGLVLVLLPPKKTYDDLKPEELLQQLTSPSRFVSPDDVADRIIKKDPSLLLVDVRNPEQYLEYSLPGALNIPIQDIFQPEQEDFFAQQGLQFIFFSNGDILADQAWILCKRKGMKNIFVMKGGLNEWFSSFFLLQPPPETASGEDIALYQFRSGVRQFFTGGETETVVKPDVEKITVAPRAKKSAVEGGC